MIDNECDIKKFKSKCHMCLKPIESKKDSYALIGVFMDNNVDYDPVRKGYLKHYLDREFNLCIHCYQKVINFISGSDKEDEE